MVATIKCSVTSRSQRLSYGCKGQSRLYNSYRLCYLHVQYVDFTEIVHSENHLDNNFYQSDYSKVPHNKILYVSCVKLKSLPLTGLHWTNQNVNLNLFDENIAKRPPSKTCLPTLGYTSTSVMLEQEKCLHQVTKVFGLVDQCWLYLNG